MSNRIVSSRRVRGPWRRCSLVVAFIVAAIAPAHQTAAASAIGRFKMARSDPVLAAAGDIACDPRSRSFERAGPDGCGMRKTQHLLGRIDPDAILTLGDNQYVCGAYRAFERSFDSTWGRFGRLLHPTPGDHEYMTEKVGGKPCSTYPNASGYFRYFGRRAVGRTGRSWYSFGLRTRSGSTWHIISLNSNCGRIAGGCARGSPEERWLRHDLATHARRCTLAYWYNPRFSSGNHGNDPSVTALWQDLYRAGAEIVLNGHSHDYERFARQTPSGKWTTSGIREFVVGTGGIGLYPMQHRQPLSQAFSASSLGVLRLQLGPGKYSWRFVHTDGESFSDSGAERCHAPLRSGSG
jgi:Calcineurin-like phosphoesterase